MLPISSGMRTGKLLTFLQWARQPLTKELWFKLLIVPREKNLKLRELRKHREDRS